MTGSTECLNSIQCLSPNRQPIDWFIVYKLPGHTMGGNNFYYMDNNNLTWTLAGATLDQPSNAVYYTLQQVYKQNASDSNSWNSGPPEQMYLMYNDEKPGPDCPKQKAASTSHGHTKGVISFDDNTGFWLIHSMPKYPQKKSDGYKWCDNVNTYGQSFLCISMNTSQSLDKVGNQLLYNYPQIFDSSLPPSFATKYPNMAAAVAMKHVTASPWQKEVELKSLAGTSFISFAKYSKFNADLYSDWLAPRFRQTLLVETWQNGRNKLCSNCTGIYKVYNVEDVHFQEKDHTFTETSDHSKWAVTNSSDVTWTCVGDINRQKSQMTRPGGTVCFQNKQVWKSFHDLVKDYHDCNPYKGCVKY